MAIIMSNGRRGILPRIHDIFYTCIVFQQSYVHIHLTAPRWDIRVFTGVYDPCVLNKYQKSIGNISILYHSVGGKIGLML